MYKFESLTQDKKERINWFLYRKYILRSYLYSYYEKMCKINFYRKIFIVENNAEFHFKTQWIIVLERKIINLKNAFHFINSFDLHFIETVFEYMKNSVKKYNLVANEAFEAVKERARQIILTEWKERQMKAIIVICKDFKNKLQTCKNADGINHFHD